MRMNFLDILCGTLRTPQGSVLNLPVFFLNIFVFHNLLFLADGRKTHGFTYYLHTNELSHRSLSPEYLNCLLSISPWVSNKLQIQSVKLSSPFFPSHSSLLLFFFFSDFLKPQVFYYFVPYLVNGKTVYNYQSHESEKHVKVLPFTHSPSPGCHVL